MKNVRIGLLAVIVLGLGACAGESEGGAKSAEPAVTTTPTKNTTTTTEKDKEEEEQETTTTTTLPDSFPIGTRVETERGNFFTLHGYEQPIPPAQFSEPDPGNEYGSADVEFCRGAEVGEDGFQSSIGPGAFELQMGDNTRRTFDLGVKEPALNYTEVPSIGDCVRGWVTYQVPVGIRPKFVEKFEAVGIHLPSNIFGSPF